MYETLKPELQKELENISKAGLYKNERVITTAQGADIKTSDGREVINFCANNYLGLSAHPAVIEAAKKAIDSHGFGMSSVRFYLWHPGYS
jgi:glycine C-acetyltransferase